MSTNIDRVDVRGRLKPRRDPYWKRLTQGRYVGFRYMTKGTAGVWLARIYAPDKPPTKKRKEVGGYHYKSLGDFAALPEKERFDAAKRAAEEHFRHLDMGGTPKSTSVRVACQAYVEKLREKSEAAATDAEGRFKRLVYDDPIANVALAKLAPRHLADWRTRVLVKGGSHASFNRNATALRRALNLARERREVASDHAWAQELKPFKNADGRRTLYLDREERRRLIDSASDELKPLLRALALSPMRPGDPAKLRVQDLNTQQRVLRVPSGKTEARIIPLGQEALVHFKTCAKGKLPTAWLLSQADGKQWTKEAWRDLIHEAAKAAKLPKNTSAYTLRHSVITDMVTGGLDLFTIAKISGTSIAMIEKHYGHLRQEHARKALDALALG